MKRGSIKVNTYFNGSAEISTARHSKNVTKYFTI
jgi:hypothetical protein